MSAVTGTDRIVLCLPEAEPLRASSCSFDHCGRERHSTHEMMHGSSIRLKEIVAEAHTSREARGQRRVEAKNWGDVEKNLEPFVVKVEADLSADTGFDGGRDVQLLASPVEARSIVNMDERIGHRALPEAVEIQRREVIPVGGEERAVGDAVRAVELCGRPAEVADLKSDCD